MLAARSRSSEPGLGPGRVARVPRRVHTLRRLPALLVALSLYATLVPGSRATVTARQAPDVPADVLWQASALMLGVGTVSDLVVAAQLEQRFGLLPGDARQFVERAGAYLERLRIIDDGLRRSAIVSLAQEGHVGDGDRRFVRLPPDTSTMREAVAGTGLIESGRALRGAEVEEFIRILRIDLSTDAMAALERWVMESVAPGLRRFDVPPPGQGSNELQEKLRKGKR